MITNEAFIDAWIKAHKQGDNQSELALELGMTRQGVSHRAIKMKEAGVKLPRLNSIPAEELNKRLESNE